MLSLSYVPVEFHASLSVYIERWQDSASASQQQRLQQCLTQFPQLAEQLPRMLVLSEFVADYGLDHTDEFLACLESGLWNQALSLIEWQALLTEQCVAARDALDEQAFSRALRIFRRCMMFRIVWRDLCRLDSMLATVEDMSILADAVIQAAISFFYAMFEARWGKPIGKYSGSEQPLVVLGMGKLGGRELNVSSDIDLIFTYPEGGATAGGRKSISNHEFFLKLGQKIIQSLDTVTGDGFVFRVDMRLRPYGQSGALALNFDAMEEYYQTQGREWERYAMIKARVVSGDASPGGIAAGKKLMRLLEPFVYRRYLDYSAIDSMRDMKTLINRQVQRKGMSGDVKLGSGGIREIEFVVQVFQLIRGGRDPRLRERQVLKLLPLIEQEQLLPEGECGLLYSAYVFLRNTEHAIQGYQDQQTQSLPFDELSCQRLAWAMGFNTWDDFFAQLEQHRCNVRESFNKVIAAKESKDSDVSEQVQWRDWDHVWIDDVELDELQQSLIVMGLDEPELVAKILLDLKASRAVLAMQAEGRKRLDALMPRLLCVLHAQQKSATTLQRIVLFIETVLRRTTYLVLLVENPSALQQLIVLCSGSVWIAEQLAKYPVLLDELLDVRALYSPPNKQELCDELRQQMLRVERHDLEAQMEVLRYFRMAHALRVAASEVSGVMPLMKVSDYLTWLAEAILEQVLELAWQNMSDKNGEPGVSEDGLVPEFIIVGYGKMGGIELGHGSDLDLVFIHNASVTAYTQGEKSIDNQTFFIRLGQRIIHILGAQTLTGKLYEVDMRLRPSGNSGLLAGSLTAFRKYQREDAWTWEHQALTRARVVAGGARLQADFEQTRHEVLTQKRDLSGLRDDVVNMRHKMREHLGSKTDIEKEAQNFHIKQDAGGIVDIEFMVQYAVLAWAHKASSLTLFTDNIRILGELKSAGLISDEQNNALVEAYKDYRSESHRLALQHQDSVVDAALFASQRQKIQAIWRDWFS